MIGFGNPMRELKKWWLNYQGEKVDWHLFYNRIYKLKRPKEELIQPVLPFKPKKETVEFNKKVEEGKIKAKERTNHRIETERKYNPSYYEIDITYPTMEEKLIFNRAYLREIKRQENKVFIADTPIEHAAANKMLKKLQKEYQTFLYCNQGICEQ